MLGRMTSAYDSGAVPEIEYITLNLRVLADRMEGDNQTVTDIDALRVERITSREAMRLLVNCAATDLGALRGDWRHAHRECRALAYP